jgi:CHASE2 domain-containing sensor protein
MQLKNKAITARMLTLIITPLVLLLIQVVAFLPDVTTPIERVELSARDWIMRARGVQKPSDDIVIVAVDEASFNWTGYQWPWPRTYFAQIVDELNKGGAKVVGLDVFLFEKDSDPKGDVEFSRALSESN